MMYPPTEPDWNDLHSLDEALAADGEKLRQLTGDDHGPWVVPASFMPFDLDADAALYTRDQHLDAVRAMLTVDAVAATMVAAMINTRQAAGESGPAFVKRIVRAWLEEASR